MKSALEKKAALVFGLALAGIAALGALEYRSAQDLSEAHHSIAHTREVITELQSVRRYLNRADARAQSFVLTGDPRMLEEYTGSIASVRASIQKLRKLTADNAAQQQNLDQLVFQIGDTFGAFQEEIKARQTNQMDAENVVKLEQAIRASHDRVRFTLGEMDEREAALLRQRREAAERANQRTKSVVIFESAIAFLLLSAAMVFLLFEIKQRGRAEARFRELLEFAPDSIVIVDREGRIVLTNAQTERLFGYDRKELLGQTVEMLIPDRFRAKHPGHRGGYFQSAKVRPMGTGLELHAVRKDGTEFPVEVSLSPIAANGEMVVSSAIRDITARKEIENSLHDLSGRLLHSQENERRSISSGLHDSVMQTITALIWKLGLADEHIAAGKQSAAAQGLKEAQTLADQAARELRSFSYLLYPPELNGEGLRLALRGYVDGFAHRTGIQVKLDTAAELGRLPRDTEVALFRIAQECLTNVHRHAHSPAAEVRLARDAGAISLEVRDFGKGFPDGRGVPSHTTPVTLGVGIQSIRERIRRLGGQLEIAPAQPGTLVRVTLPNSPQPSA